MENIRSLFFTSLGIIWAFVQLLLGLLILLVFTLWAVTVRFMNLSLNTKFYLARVFWEPACHLIIRVGLLTKPYVIDRRSTTYKPDTSLALYISNHQSIFDIPLILSVYQIVPVIKKELMHVPFFGLIAQASTAIPVDRKDKESRVNVIKEVQKRLKAQLPIQVYPEGTRSKTEFPKSYEEIKTALISLAYRENIVVIPSAVWGTNKITNQFGFTKFPVKLGIIVQKELYPKDFQDEESFCKACWANVLSAYEELDQNFKIKKSM